ncbi:MAG TPA: hypothetical protein VIH52_00935 [Candidatus Nanoarchaeia archaeon]|nr:hypothetical protein [uncultured archaeon]
MNQIVKIGLGLAIAIIFPLMVGLGVEAFYPSPKSQYEKCRYPVVEAAAAGTVSEKSPIYPEDDPTYKKCIDDQEKIVNTYNRNAFVVITILGFVAIAVGALFFNESLGPVAPGLVFGGLFTILYGAGRGFTAVDKRWLFAELVVLLVGLILVTRRFLMTQAKK